MVEQQSCRGGAAELSWWSSRVVVVEQQVAGAAIWTVCSPSFQDLGETHVGVALDVDFLLLLERGRGHMTGFFEEDFVCLSECAFRSLEFHM